MTTTAPTAPTAEVSIDSTGAGSITIDNHVHPLRARGSIDQARQKARSLLQARAAELGQPITMTATEPGGQWQVVVHPDGSISAPPSAASAPPPTPSYGMATTPPQPPAPPAAASTPQQPADPVDKPTQEIPTPQPAPEPQSTASMAREQARSTSLLTEVTNEAPATAGWRGALNLLGLHLAPSLRERAERNDIAAVSQHWPGPRTIAVVNGKGGATKTPATILLAAVLARHGGAGVVAYDNNATRGTLGWRTQQGPHQATVADLLPHVSHLLGPGSQAAELAAFVHHQREDRYDVLRSCPEVLADRQPTDAATFRAVHSVLAKYYRMLLVDSGNDESSPQWRAMIDKADAIVVPTITRAEHAESARLLLEELSRADAHCNHLAENAVVVVSQGSKAEPDPHELVKVFKEITRDAVGIPYDQAMSGRPLILDSLAPATRRAWLSAGASLASGLV